MKRVVSLLFVALFLNSCDDGNLIQEDISFEAVATQSCTTNNIIYKLKDKESLILEIPKSSFTNEPSLIGAPTIININSANRLVYRFYNGTISTANICETIPPVTPTVTDQWTATAGKIQIFTFTSNAHYYEQTTKNRLPDNNNYRVLHNRSCIVDISDGNSTYLVQ